jgi:Gpi18-like mannosyltransferase
LGVAACLRAQGWNPTAAINGGLLFMLLPAVMLNGIAWGQADAFYVAFVLYAMAALLSGRPLLSILLFAVAVSIKLQAILFAPFLIGFLIRTPGKLILGLVAFIPIYLLVNSLYLVAGRPVWDVLAIYAGQAQTFDRLSMNAGNLWLFADMFVAKEFLITHHRGLVLGGIAGAGLYAIMQFWQAARAPLTNPHLVVLAALTTIMLPFLLPKMHERFFFMAETFLFLLFLLDRRFLPAAIFAQFSAISMYSIYHDTFGVREFFGWPSIAFVGIFFMICAISLLLRVSPSQKGWFL